MKNGTACDRDDWLETNYTDHSNSLSWLPGYKKWKKSLVVQKLSQRIFKI